MEDQGGLFAPVEGAARPVYSAGPEKGRDNLILFQCPKSAISRDIWDLLVLWWNCRLLKCLPEAGGYLDQSKTVRDSFPMFELQYLGVERAMGQQGAMTAATAAVVGLMAGMGRK